MKRFRRNHAAAFKAKVAIAALAAERKASNGPNVKDLHAKIGQLAMENDFLAVALGRIPDASAKR